MSRPERMRRVGRLAVSAVAAAPLVYLWVTMMRDADDSPTFRARLDMVIWIAVFGTPWMIAARLLAAAAAMLPEDRRDWGAAMTAELTQVRDRGRGRSFHTGVAACAWATVLGALLLIVAWLAEAPRWYRQIGGDAAGLRRWDRDGHQPGRRHLVDAPGPGAVGPAPWRARRRRPAAYSDGIRIHRIG